MHDPGSTGPTFATWRHTQGCSYFLMRRATIGKQQQNADVPHTPPQAGAVAVPASVRPAPFHHPASC
eukprot:5121828-Prymnesium_polylepis.1